MKFHDNLSNGIRVITRAETTDGQKETTKLVAAFRTFVNAPKMERVRSFKMLVG